MGENMEPFSKVELHFHPVLAIYIGDVSLTGDVPADAVRLLRDRGRAETADHSRRVAAAAQRLARRWGEDETSAEVAGWLHDISAIVPREHRLPVAETLGVEVLAEERIAPVLVHQKLSAVIAQQVFAVVDRAVLSAIGCHTTLKVNSSALDKIVFVADKMAWDQPGTPPYLATMASAADRSIDLAAHCYLDYLWQRRETLPAMHPWALEAYRQLSAKIRPEKA
jgi:predicted HD superfamily hydrolase involved in NAD metabolism